MIFEFLQRTQKIRDYGFWILGIRALVLRFTEHGTTSTLMLVSAITLALPDGSRFTIGKRNE